MEPDDGDDYQQTVEVELLIEGYHLVRAEEEEGYHQEEVARLSPSDEGADRYHQDDHRQDRQEQMENVDALDIYR